MDWTGHLDSAVVCAVLAAVAGWFVPALIGRLPEPPEPAEDKVPYAELAAAPGLAWQGAAWSGVAAGLVGLATGWIWALPALVYLVPVGVALAYVLPQGSVLRRLVAAREELNLQSLRVEGTLTLAGDALKSARPAGMGLDSGEERTDATFYLRLPGRCRLEARSAFPRPRRPTTTARPFCAASNGGRRPATR